MDEIIVEYVKKVNETSEMMDVALSWDNSLQIFFFFSYITSNLVIGKFGRKYKGKKVQRKNRKKEKVKENKKID